MVEARGAVPPTGPLASTGWPVADEPLGPGAVLVPVKAFHDAKHRLGPVLDHAAREALVRQMAARVVAAAAPFPVAVVCDDTTVADWARQQGALVIWEPGRGLNGAVESGVAHLAGMGVRWVTVAHADLPLATDLSTLDGPEGFDGVVLVPDRRDDGTNVLRIPVRRGFRFSYGPGSFARHCAECGRLDLPLRVVRRPELTFDVDWPADLAWV
jgi:2-phospho-L-lactate guanylyltransferase